MPHLFARKVNPTYLSEASAYLKENYESPNRVVRYSLKASYNPQSIDEAMKKQSESIGHAEDDKTLNRYINATFVDHLCEYIRQRDMKDPQVYRAAHLDRRLFSKMMSGSKYQPAKDTAIALAFALRLNLNEVTELLFSAGYTLSHSIQRDVIIEYFFRAGIYDLSDINAVLEEMGQKEIGR